MTDLIDEFTQPLSDPPHMYWITPSGNYRECMYVPLGSIPVTQRPSPCHVWVNSAWSLPTPSAEAIRRAAIDQAIESDTVITSLKAMTNAEFDAWWAANVTNAAQAISVLKRIARVVIRRIL